MSCNIFVAGVGGGGEEEWGVGKKSEMQEESLKPNHEWTSTDHHNCVTSTIQTS